MREFELESGVELGRMVAGRLWFDFWKREVCTVVSSIGSCYSAYKYIRNKGEKDQGRWV